MRYWVVKGQPASFEPDANYRAGREDEWWTGRPPREWTAGDRLFFWRSSPDRRIFTLGTLGELAEPRLGRRKGYSYFKVRYLAGPLMHQPSIDELRAFFRTRPSFLKAGPSGTLFPLTVEHGEQLYRIILQFNPDLHLAWADVRPSEEVEFSGGEPELSAVEGGRELVLHLRRERDQRLVRAKKAAVLRSRKRLACEACGFDFCAVYGQIGDGFCEVHHEKPLGQLKKARRYSLADLRILCSNCHRMIHKTLPILRVALFRKLVARARA